MADNDLYTPAATELSTVDNMQGPVSRRKFLEVAATVGISGAGMAMGFGRRFISREEIIARLENYKKQLEAETKGVEEHIAELKKQGESIQE